MERKLIEEIFQAVSNYINKPERFRQLEKDINQMALIQCNIS
jgi:hypothetical protein